MPFFKKNDAKKGKDAKPWAAKDALDGDEDKTDLRVKESRENDIIDAKYGFNRVADNQERVRRYFGVIKNTSVTVRCAHLR